MYDLNEITERPETRPKRRHFYSTTEAETTLSILRALVPDASDSKLIKLGLASLVNHLKIQSADEIEREIRDGR